MNALKKLNPYFLKHKWLLHHRRVSFVIVSVVFKLFPALLIRNSFDTIARVIEEYKNGAVRDETVRWELIRYGSVYYCFGRATRASFMYFMRQTIIVMSRHIEYDLKNVVFDHYQRLTHSVFSRETIREI